MHRVIEIYDFERTVVIDDRTYPASALLEDEDGVRAFLHPGRVRVRDWLREAPSYLLEPREGTVVAVTAAAFSESRDSLGDQFYVPRAKDEIVFDHMPMYTEVVRRVITAPEIVPVTSGSGLVHLHTHSEYSPLDGLSTVEEIVQTVVEMDHWAVGISDHGYVPGHPDLAKSSDKHGIKPVYGLEAYFVDDRISRPEGPEDVKRLRDYYHLVLFAKTQQGLFNLWAMSTESHSDGFYGKPRIDWDTLARHREGIVATTACLRGPLSHKALLDGRDDIAMANLSRLLEIYGDDLFIEIHANQLPEQIKVNQALVGMAKSVGVPMVVAVDSHYPKKDDVLAHRTWLSIQTDSDISDDSALFSGGQSYHLASEAEVRESLSYLNGSVVDEVISNSSLIASRCDATIKRRSVTPVFVKNGGPKRDEELLREVCESNWHLTEGRTHPDEVYRARFEEEMALLVEKGFCGYFNMVSDYCREARRQGILVGPGRGSGGGTLVGYLSEIISIDPVEADLLFARFLNKGRMELPDFDVDFPQSKKHIMQTYVAKKYGEDHVAVVGSITRLKSKGIVRDLARAMKSVLPENIYLDINRFSDLVEEAEADTAGLGVPWEDLWIQNEQVLTPFREKYPDLFAMADRLVGRVKTYGQHAAGMVISTDEPLTGRLPLRKSGSADHLVCQFDKDVVETLGFLKFDLLTLRNLDTIQETIDLIRERRGIEVNLYGWRDEYDDPQVWEEIGAGHTLGVFQIETPSSTPLVKRMKPVGLLELSDAITLVRPGPKNSGLTEIYLRRRAGQEPVSYPDERMEGFLASTWGAMIYQEQIMAACMVLAGYDETEADGVRSILGKKKVDKIPQAGAEFISRAVDHGMDRTAAEHLWAQMAEFAKYSFNKAHAYGYAVLAYWCAFLKVHYPVEFMAAALSTVDKGRAPDFIKEANRLGIKVLPPDINDSRLGYTVVDNTTIRFGLDSVKGVGQAGANGLLSGQPYTSFDDVIERMGPGADMGVIRILSHVGVFDSLVPNRRALETRLMVEKQGLDTICVFKTDAGVPLNEHDLPCRFDWANEPSPVNPKTGKRLKPKPVPKRCTKACRNYTAPEPRAYEDIEPYGEADILAIEQEVFGIPLSASPFDRLDPDDRSLLKRQAEAYDVAMEGSFLVAAVVTRVKPHKTKTGDPMGFVDFSTEVVDISAVCFPSIWEKYRKDLKPGALCLVDLSKNARGASLKAFTPVN